MFKKHMTPLTAGGQRTVHQGKGSQMSSMPDRSQIKGLANGNGSINDYAKASPAPMPEPSVSAPTGSYGLGG